MTAISGNYSNHPRKSTYISIASIHSCAGCLYAYDARHSSLLRIRPSSGQIDAFHLPLDAEGYTRLVAWHENLVIFAEGGQEREVLGELGNFQKATSRQGCPQGAWCLNFLRDFEMSPECLFDNTCTWTVPWSCDRDSILSSDRSLSWQIWVAVRM